VPITRLPLVFNIESRSADLSKDSKTVNAIIEGEELVKRPGLSLFSTIGTSNGQGLVSWLNQTVVAANNHIYLVDSLGTATEVLGSPLTGSNLLPLSFSQTDNGRWLVFHDGSNIYAMPAPGVITASISIGSAVVTYTDTGNKTIGQPVSGTGIPANSVILSINPGVSFTITHNATANNATAAITLGTIVIAVIGGTGVSSVSVNVPGGYYTSVPNVVFSGAGGGPQATGLAVLNTNGTLFGVTLLTPGTYTAGQIPTITIDAPPAGTQATITTNWSHSLFGWYIASITVNSGGSGYLGATLTFSTTNALSVATGFVNITNGVITSISIVNQGVYSSQGGSTTISAPVDTRATTTANMSSTITGPFAAGIAYLDTVLYLMNETSGLIYGSLPDDPTTWTASTSIGATSDTDSMIGLVRHQNYIVAFGTLDTEFFYDAGNPLPGSPLSVAKSYYMEIGCANGYSIAKAEQTLLWVGVTESEGRSVYLLDGLTPVKLSTRYIEKYLNADPMINVRSCCLKIAGHSLYILSLQDSNITIVYDLDEKKWYQWTSQTGDTTGLDGTENLFLEGAFSTRGSIATGIGTYLVQASSTGNVYSLSSSVYDDAGNKIYFRAVSPRTDSGTNKVKFYKRAELIGDVAGTVNGNIRHCDDDYATWSSYRQVDMTTARPVLYQNGQGRRRIWEVFISDSVPIRLRALEIESHIGEGGSESE
jgi:hypothetical protein